MIKKSTNVSLKSYGFTMSDPNQIKNRIDFDDDDICSSLIKALRDQENSENRKKALIFQEYKLFLVINFFTFLVFKLQSTKWTILAIVLYEWLNKFQQKKMHNFMFMSMFCWVARGEVNSFRIIMLFRKTNWFSKVILISDQSQKIKLNYGKASCKSDLDDIIYERSLDQAWKRDQSFRFLRKPASAFPRWSRI